MLNNSAVIVFKKNKYIKNNIVELIWNLCILIKKYNLKNIYVNYFELLNDDLYLLLSAIKNKYSGFEIIGYITKKSENLINGILKEIHRCDKIIVYENEKHFLFYKFYIIVKNNHVEIINNKTI